MMMRFCNHHHHRFWRSIRFHSVPLFIRRLRRRSSSSSLKRRRSKRNTNLSVFLPLLTPPFVSTVDPTRTRVRTRTRPRRRSPCLFSALSLLSCCCCCCSLCFWIWIWRLRARRRQQPGHRPSRGSPCFVAILLRRKRRKLDRYIYRWFMTTISITSIIIIIPSLFDNTFY